MGKEPDTWPSREGRDGAVVEKGQKGKKKGLILLAFFDRYEAMSVLPSFRSAVDTDFCRQKKNFAIQLAVETLIAIKNRQTLGISTWVPVSVRPSRDFFLLNIEVKLKEWILGCLENLQVF